MWRSCDNHLLLGVRWMTRSKEADSSVSHRKANGSFKKQKMTSSLDPVQTLKGGYKMFNLICHLCDINVVNLHNISMLSGGGGGGWAVLGEGAGHRHVCAPPGFDSSLPVLSYFCVLPSDCSVGAADIWFSQLWLCSDAACLRRASFILPPPPTISKL